MSPVGDNSQPTAEPREAPKHPTGPVWRNVPEDAGSSNDISIPGLADFLIQQVAQGKMGTLHLFWKTPIYVGCLKGNSYGCVFSLEVGSLQSLHKKHKQRFLTSQQNYQGFSHGNQNKAVEKLQVASQ